MTGEQAAPILGVHDVEASLAYYTGVLGFTCDREHGVFGDGGETAYAILAMGDAGIHLQIRSGDGPPAHRHAVETDVYVYVPAADALLAEQLAAGATLHRPIEDAEYGMRDYVVATPDGHRIAFGSSIG